MAKSKSTRNIFWKEDWFAAAVIIVSIFILHQVSGGFSFLENKLYDFASTQSNRKPNDSIAVIAIDDQSIANIGRWPWPRDVQARLIDQLKLANAKVIVNTTFYFEPQEERGLAYIRKIKQAIAPPTEQGSSVSAQDQQIAEIVAAAEMALDSDGKLASSMKTAGNVLIPSYFDLGEPVGRPDKALPTFALKSSIEENEGFSELALGAQNPIDLLGTAAAGVGHLNMVADADGTVRTEALLVNYYGKAIPSLALLAALTSLNLSVADITLKGRGPEKFIYIGKLRISTNASAAMRPQFYPAGNNKPAFVTDSFYDVVSGKIPVSKYSGKIVVIGANAAGVGVQFATPAFPASSPAELVATVISSILNEHFIVSPDWSITLLFVLLMLIPTYLIFGLPRFSAGVAATVTGGLLVVLLGTEYVLLSRQSVWLPLVFPAALLIIGHVLITTKRFLMTEAGKVQADEESAETNRMMGLALQGQGQLDMAFDRFRRVPMNEAVMGNLYSLAMDFERKRQFNKAEAVYEHMAAFDKGYKDVKAKLNRAKNLSETVMLGGAGGHPGGTMLLEGGAVEKPMLGRYQVEKELGKGAMGVVYLGKDPKIGRVVAIKTMALSQEFAGDELVDARERFFREAETAGRLQHQNIVTIFDAGEEHDLAYIAMEFLKGKDLADHCKGEHLLAVPVVLSIVARVAEALAYAHKQNVVHRDIKPANIMYEAQSDTVKVTDFGIARITDSSKTKTGLVLGTPSFMSPEQLAGKKVDGRSDLYSLGVMLFQMLAGVLPFRGDSMSELMYKIANEEAPDIRIIRSELPQNLADVVALSLSKRPETRYQTGDRFAVDLRSVMSQMSGAAPVAPLAKPLGEHPSTEKTVAFNASGPSVSNNKADFTATVPASAVDFEKTVVQRVNKPGEAN